MGGAWSAPMLICSSNTSTTNSPNKKQRNPQTRSRREGGAPKAPGGGLKQRISQPDFVVNIILLIGRIVKRNLGLHAIFLWKSGWSSHRAAGPSEWGVLPAGAGGAPAGSGVRSVCLFTLKITSNVT